MMNDDIDRVLFREDDILPSSGFTVSVMDAVRREAAAPPPIPFPWRRALPGLVVGAAALLVVFVASVSAVVRLTKEYPSSQLPLSLPSGMPPAFHGALQSAVIWTVLGLLLAFVSVKVSTRAA